MCVQEKGWMDGHLMKRWIRDVWIVHTQRRKALLVMDSSRAHCTEDIQDVLARANSNISFIPGGCSSKCQPLDVSLNKPFKTICQKSFSTFCRSQLSTMSDPTDRLKTASKQQVVQWVEEAHKYLSERPEMVIKSFQVTGISLALDGSENSSFRSDSCLNLPTEVQGEEESEDAEEDPFQDLDADSDLELED